MKRRSLNRVRFTMLRNAKFTHTHMSTEDTGKKDVTTMKKTFSLRSLVLFFK